MKKDLQFELLEYAYPKKRIEVAQKQYKTSKTEDIFGYIGSVIVLSLCSLPMIFHKIWLWAITFALYATALIICKIIKDKYERNMLLYGSTLAYLGITFSYFFAREALERFQISVAMPLLVLSAFGILFYEIFFAANVIFKRYSAKNNNIKTYPAGYSAIGISVGSVIGWIIAKNMTPVIENSLWSVWLTLLGMALLFVLAVSFLQKYFLYKLLKNQTER